MNKFLKNGSGMYECATNNRSYHRFDSFSKSVYLRNNCSISFEFMWNLFTPIKHGVI